MTEFPIVDIITNKKYKNLNKSNNFKERQRKFKRQEKQAKQISELPNKFQKAIKAAVITIQEKKPNPKSNPKLMYHKQKKMPISARSVQNILDEEYEGQLDAIDLLIEIAIEENLLEYLRQEEEEIQSVVEEYERLVKEAEKDYQFDYCDDLFDLREDFVKDMYNRYHIGGSWSSDDEE